MDIEKALDELLSMQALRDLTARLARGQDRRDRKLMLSCCHPDAYDDHGHFRGTREALADYCMDTMASALGADPTHPAIQHSITNQLFEVDGDRASGESYVFVRFIKPDQQPGWGWGRYVDDFERRDGEWRIARRRVVVDNQTALNPASGYVPTPGGYVGRHDMRDPSYDKG
jgi:hypothetical protein